MGTRRTILNPLVWRRQRLVYLGDRDAGSSPRGYTESMTRTEHDSLGAVEVPAERLWGAQTERSRNFFAIGAPRFVWTRPVIRGLGLLKKAAALANGEL